MDEEVNNDSSDYSFGNVNNDSSSYTYDPTENYDKWDRATDEYIKNNYPEIVSEDPSLVSSITAALKNMGTDGFKKLTGMFTSKDGTTNWRNVAAAAGGLYGLYKNQQPQPKTGYQGGIPSYTAVREKVTNTYDPDRRPGSTAQEYFTKTRFVAPKDAETARSAAKTEAAGLETLNKNNPAREARDVLQAGAEKKETATPTKKLASGGIAEMAQGRYLGGATDGMADKIPARIGGKQEAKLSHGEFVIPADVVGHLGNGNSEAGAQRLYAMMDKIRKARTGTTKQGKQINPDKFLA